MTNTHCPDCGYNFAAFGKVHRCVPRPREVSNVEGRGGQAAGTPRVEHHTRLQEVQTNDAPKTVVPDTAQMKSEKLLEKPPGTYKYRDPDKWRAYMREFMRKKRSGR